MGETVIADDNPWP